MLGSSTALRAFARLGWLITVAAACSAAQEPSLATLTITGDRATVRGRVRENIKRCEVDGACYLVLASASGDVRVEYHHGESPRCENVAAIQIGLAIRPGESVEAGGAYTRASTLHRIDVCCPDCYLKVTPDP